MKWIRKQIYWIASIAVAGTVLWLVATGVTAHSMQVESAGILFGRSVPLQDYLDSLRAVTHQAIFANGDRYRQNVTDKELEERAWERLLFLWEARRKGIRVSDKEVVQEIQSSPLFQRNGQFDPQGYQAVMQYSLGTTPRAFEEESRGDLMIQKMFKKVVGNPSVTEKEAHDRFLQQGGAMRIDFVVVQDAAAAREIADACRQQPDRLEPIARKNGLKVAATDSFKEDGTIAGVGSAASLFSQMAALKPGEAAGPFRSPGGWVVARLKERMPPDEKEFASQRQALEKEILGQKRLRSYLAWYQELLQRAKPRRKALPSQGQ